MPGQGSRETLENYSDLIVYVTVKDIVSEWNTNDGKTPPAVQEKFDVETPFGIILWTPPYDIHTNMIVTVDSWAKGDSPEEITIVL